MDGSEVERLQQSVGMLDGMKFELETLNVLWEIRSLK